MMGTGKAAAATLAGCRVFWLCLLLLCCSGGFRGAGAQELTLPKYEVDALKLIDAKLKVGWNFSVNPCGGQSGWLDKTFDPSIRNVTCGDCNATTNVCHVVSIMLKSQNLTGVLPAEMATLRSLQQIDLTRNYINGTIPPEWGSLPLVNITLLGNRISGEIPPEIGNITTLKSLVLENNMFQGRVPPSLGRLRGLERLHLSANDFTGVLPDSLGNLMNLTEFRIDGTGISGNIPNFIGNWTKLSIFNMQGTSLEGSFPVAFSTLTSLLELRATDFKGDGKFPPLQNMNIRYLILRNCSISGPLPEYIGKMTNLKILDLSFNKFMGEIPRSFDGLETSINNLYLTNNNMTGPIPSWILRSKQNMDLSYNNFTGTPSPSNCQQGNINFVASYSSTEDNLIHVCFRKNFPCSGKAKNYNLFINCGGKKIIVGDTVYEEDSPQQGASTFIQNQNWAYSSTGDFFNNGKAKYIATNTSVLNMSTPELYTTARLNPSSLKYYGLCLQKGNYTVNLHFAEIMFTNDQTFSSVGRRFFDVSIQGKKVLKDFNIVEAANGTGRDTIQTFNTLVEDSTLEIHFQWAGKGTNALPERGVYGPLISAISVTPNFKPDLGNSLSIGAILGIVAASCVAMLLVIFLLWFYLRKRHQEDNGLKGLDLQTGYFSLKQIKSATGNFDSLNKIGEGGFGPVYKGVLPDGSVIAVKQLSSKSRQGNREFINEIGMITALQHPNLVKLFGCCIEGNQLLLIYEYMENNSLARALFGPEGVALQLDWETRRKICLGIARGLAYLHEESRLKIVHRDIKATNVLLDKDLNAKISDFGLAKLDDEENTHISTRVAGTIGYMAPEYAMRGYLTDKADVYSFGVVMLEVISGKSNANYRPKEDFIYLLDWAHVLQERGNVIELVDAKLGSGYSKEEAQVMLDLSLLCASPSPTVRPAMSAVVSILEGKMPLEVPSVKQALTENEELRFRSFQKQSLEGREISADGPWVSSSVTTSSKDASSQFSASPFN